MLLLDSGSNPAVRSTAAAQLGEIVRAQPQQLLSLVSRIMPFLRSKSWDTRHAAALAIEHVARSCPAWEPAVIKSALVLDDTLHVKSEHSPLANASSCSSSSTARSTADNDDDDLLTFVQFNICNVLRYGSFLVGSSGNEYDDDEIEGEDPADRLKRQRKALNKQLGIQFEEGEYLPHV